MKGIFVIVFAVSIYSVSSFSQKVTFVEKCLEDTKILKSNFSCFAKSVSDQSVLVVNLVKGERLSIYSTGSFGYANKNMTVLRIQHLGPRVTDFGALNESLRFIGNQNEIILTLNVQCHQPTAAIIGVGKTNKPEVTTEYATSCWLN